MRTRPLGARGPEVSALGLGCNTFGPRLDAAGAAAVVHAALDAGITHFDTADVYGDGASERYLGAALGSRRDDVVLATKVGIRRDAPTGGLARERVVAACEASLARLGTDRIDVYYLHRPDPGTPREETVAALQQLVEQGKVRHVACSNHPAWQVADLWHLAAAGSRPPVVAVQLGLSILDRSAEAELLPAVRHLGLGAVAFAPLASGLLTGKYPRDGSVPAGSRLHTTPQLAGAIATPAALAVADDVRLLAEARGVRPAALALSWAAAQPGVASVLTGATSADQIRRNAEDVVHPLEPEVVEHLDRLLTPAHQEAS